MPVYDDFGKLLNRYLVSQERNPSWLANRLGVVASTAARWSNGEMRPSTPEMVIRIADVLHVHDGEHRQALLLAAGYGYAESGDGAPAGDDALGVLRELFDLLNNLRLGWRRLLEQLGMESAQSKPWQERALDVVLGLVGQIGPRGLLSLLGIVGLWLLADWLTGPILHWPLVGQEAQRAASMQFGAATLVLPLLLALLTQINPEGVAKATDAKKPGAGRDRWALLLLKWAGAMVGFHLLIFGALAVTLALYYLRGYGVATTGRVVLVALSLLAGYLCAYVIPTQRYRLMGRFQVTPVDRLVLFAFLLVGPGSALFVYAQRDLLESRYFGVLLWVVIVGYLLWAYRQQNPAAVAPGLLIFLWGALLPAIILLAPLALGEPAPVLPLYELAVFVTLVIGQGVLVATLYVKGKANLFWPLLFWVLVLELLGVLVLLHDLGAGLLVLGALGLCWGALWLLGKGAAARYLWIHNYYWLMQGVLVASLALWGYGVLAPWLTALLHSLVAGGLTGWIMRQPIAAKT